MTDTQRTPGAPAAIAFFVTGYGVWSSPSLVNAARLLAERGYEVDIFTDTSDNSDFVNPDGLPIRIFRVGRATSSDNHAGTEGGMAGPAPRSFRRRVRELLPGPVDRAVLAIWIVGPRLYGFVAGARRVMGTRRYECFVGAETTGLAAASVLGRLRRTPVVYWSLELWLWSEAKSLYYRLLKLLEFTFHRSAAFTIIPSESWIPLLSRENGVQPSKFVVVPATARGPAYRTRTRYLQARFRIGDDRTVVLYAGSLVSWALTRELVTAARGWPREIALVIHGWGDAEYIESLKAIAAGDERVFFSLDVVPFEELDQLIASADVGVALYRNDIMARQLISSASSKIGQYLKCGVPVITDDSAWFQEMFGEYECGVGVARHEDMLDGITRITANHARFRREAFRCFDERYDFDVHFSSVLARLEALHTDGGSTARKD